LRQDYAHFNFYQLVRLFLLERRQRLQDKEGVRPAQAPADNRELDRALRFDANLEAAFPGREVSAVSDGGDKDDDQQRVHIGTNNYCLAGYQGPLPETYSEWIRDQLREGNPDLADFLNLFNHRFNVLRYQLKTRHRPALESGNPEQTRLAGYLQAGIGLFTPDLAEQLPLPIRTLLGLSGLLANPRRSMPMITAVLGTYLQAPVRLEPLQGGWRTIEEDDRCALGLRNSRLGRDSLAGSRCWDEQAKVLIVIGPIAYPRFLQLLPEKNPRQHAALVALLRFLLNRRCDCQLRFLVRGDSLPAMRLSAADGDDPEAAPGLFLGHSAWAASAASTILHPVELTIPAYDQREAA
jgi:type VI secretion system ImpH/TssG family protein